MTQQLNERIKTAIEFMKEGKSFLVGDLRFGTSELNEVKISGWSNYVNLRNIDRNIALKELMGIKSQFLASIESSPELETFIKDKVIEYVLFLDDYGKGSIQLVSEKNGIIKWTSVLSQS